MRLRPVALFVLIGCAPVISDGTDDPPVDTDPDTDPDTDTDTDTDTDPDTDTDTDTDPVPREACGEDPAAAGVAWSREALAGVTCGGQQCGTDQKCCFSITSGCTSLGTRCAWSEATCDGPEDCPGSQVCCAGGKQGVNQDISCRDSCPAGQDRVCSGDEDCEAGDSCVRAWSNEARLKVGRCQERLPSTCDLSDGSGCSDVDLAGLDLSGVKLEGADLRDSNLTSSWWRFASFVEADLRGACLVGAAFKDADLSRADLRGAIVERTGFPQRMRGANLAGMNLDGQSSGSNDLQEADLTGVTWRNGAVNRVDFRGADLTDADFTGSYMTYVNLEGATVDGATFTAGEFYFEVICPDGSVAPQSRDYLRCWE